jgi:hypothetical protein
MFLIRIAVLVMLLMGCRAPENRPRVVLIAPFEGRYRQVGYDALYAAWLAFADSGQAVDFLPLDDGGTSVTARARARAVSADPLVMFVLLIGYHATADTTQTTLGDLPYLVIGEWSAQRASPNGFILSNPAIASHVTTPPRIDVTDAAALPAPFVGGDVLTLDAFALLRRTTNAVQIFSSGRLPDHDFRQRIQALDAFAPPPSVLSTLTYDAAQIAVQAARTGSRASALQTVSDIDIVGINGRIRFDQYGYWLEAPIYAYRYVDGALQPADGD